MDTPINPSTERARRIANAIAGVRLPDVKIEVRVEKGNPSNASNNIFRTGALTFAASMVMVATLAYTSLPSKTQNNAGDAQSPSHAAAQVFQNSAAPNIAAPVQAQPAAAAPAAPGNTYIVIIDGKQIHTLTPADRIELCKVVAKESNLKASNLDWTDLYAIVHAETAWAPRDGMGHNGKISRGLAQLEDATARSLGVDANDPKQALGAVASLLKEAVNWGRVKGHAKNSGFISVYYNVSTLMRNAWDSSSIESLPPETQIHIKNVIDGKRFAIKYDTQIQAVNAANLKMSATYVTRAPAVTALPATLSAPVAKDAGRVDQGWLKSVMNRLTNPSAPQTDKSQQQPSAPADKWVVNEATGSHDLAEAPPALYYPRQRA